MRAPKSVSLRRLGSIRFQKNGFLWAYGADFAKLTAPKFFLFAGAAGAIHCRPKPSQYVDMLETVEFFFHLESKPNRSRRILKSAGTCSVPFSARRLVTPRYRLLFNITDEAAVSSGG